MICCSIDLCFDSSFSFSECKKVVRCNHEAQNFSAAPYGAENCTIPLILCTGLAYSTFLKISEILQKRLAYSTYYMLVRHCMSFLDLLSSFREEFSGRFEPILRPESQNSKPCPDGQQPAVICYASPITAVLGIFARRGFL